MDNINVTIKWGGWGGKEYSCEMAPVLLANGAIDCYRGHIKRLDMVIDYDPSVPYPYTIHMESSNLNEDIHIDGIDLQDTINELYNRLERIRDYLNEILWII